MDVLLAYIDAWRRHDVGAVLNTLAEDCLIIECYGPVYRGRCQVERWMRTWFGAGGTVDSWDVTWHAASQDLRIAEWRFGCTWRGDSESFDGATIARLCGPKIAYLREYATTAPLYDWPGAWRD